MGFRTRVGVSALEVRCVIGANLSERDRRQPVHISFEIEYGPLDPGGAGSGPVDPGGAGSGPGARGGPVTDELDAAVDYAAAADRIRGIAEEGRYVLVETLAQAVAEELSRDTRVVALSVECRKPEALPDAAYAYARVSWARG
ncbi:MAG: dihydroneopterin aldolase [Spirochaetota bacterium]